MKENKKKIFAGKQEKYLNESKKTEEKYLKETKGIDGKQKYLKESRNIWRKVKIYLKESKKIFEGKQ